MQNNIFQNAYFGKAYKTRDGRKAVYLGDNTCWIEGREIEIGYSRNGLFVDFQEHGIDIVSEWKEEINEKELDKLAEQRNINKQVLTIEKMQELIDMGVDVSKASMCWNYNEENSYWTLVINDTHSPYIKGEIVPVFTLYDLMEMIPKNYEIRTSNYVRYIIECVFDDETSDCHIEKSDDLLIAAFEMIKWCRQNKYI